MNNLFGNYVELRAYRLAFWDMVELEQPEELEDKIPHTQKLKDENYARCQQLPRCAQANPVEKTAGQVDDGTRRSSPQQSAGPDE